MKAATYQEYRTAFAGTSLPFAWLDLNRLEANAIAISARAGDKKVRIASKSVRSVEVLRMIFALSPKFQGLMCFTGPEAVWLSQTGFDDLLIAYPVFQREQLAAICAEVKKGKKLICMIDSAEHVRQLDAVASASNVILPVCIDLDMSIDPPGIHFGVYRSPINSVEKALALHADIKQAKHLRLNSLMGYEAQVAGLGDRIPGQKLKNIVIRMLKRRSIKLVAARRKAVVEALVKDGAQLEIVNGGGVGSMEFTRDEAVVTEIAAGSGFFQSHLFDYYDNFRHEPAAGFAVEIVRQPQPGMWTCHGGGYIASGSIGQEKVPLPYLPVGAKLHPNEGAGEVQTPIVYGGPEKLQLGDPVFFRHSKAGELCERFNQLVLIKDGKVNGAVNTYRGDGKCFL
ncbi:MAG: amino acid deaminase/aldolase [Bacteroidetes bacterium]|nr:amino acid deaminase/aldolase [Bacteroidota bacterium]